MIEITHIALSGPKTLSPYERVSRLWWRNDDNGDTGPITMDLLFNLIRDGARVYVIDGKGGRCFLSTARTRRGERMVRGAKTEEDDPLLNLPGK